ncbi:class I SAM-dependent methyltransferase [Nocardia sp. BSTN01]|nr:class I SAM-dependent methyltransferase [Nocardia sp. BSTN01]
MSPEVLTDDPYALSAEFYDVMAAPHWATKREFLVAALRAAGPIDLPIVDIGAGSGLSTMAIAETVDDVAIHAVEPSPAMRAALVSRILSHHNAFERVTVQAGRAENIVWPDRIGAVSMMGVVGYLDPDVRHELWANIRSRLPAGAPVVVEYMPLSTPVTVPEFTIAQKRIGQHIAEVRIAGEPASDTAERWTMRYLVHEGQRVVRDFTAEHVWETVGIETLREEASHHGLNCEEVSPIIGVLRPSTS